MPQVTLTKPYNNGVHTYPAGMVFMNDHELERAKRFGVVEEVDGSPLKPAEPKNNKANKPARNKAVTPNRNK